MRCRRMIAALLFAVAGLYGVQELLTPQASVAADPPAAKAAVVPVTDSMHDFMEGLFQAPYRRLKAGIAADPKDNAGWKAVRSDAMILAEGGNLLISRKPEKDAEKWVEYSVASRDAGAELFKAAKKKDYAGARMAYAAMLTHCNACHKQFDNGKHQLEP